METQTPPNFSNQGNSRRLLVHFSFSSSVFGKLDLSCDGGTRCWSAMQSRLRGRAGAEMELFNNSAIYS
ncbi:hypothetical protein NDU88_003541 [Pleurodeles waltl]|uniref:Uncharacterized protein n=1 Tax=Pleurodeles waltl TaxID=8319 RepID=A0AAV7LIW5_PLEWA|nr:hypothetical protein NDU88_003541 [Pleurodeles waltl]